MCLKALRIIAVPYRRLCVNNLVYTVSSNNSSWKHNWHHSKHKEWHNYLHCISNKCCHWAYLHNTAVNSVRSHPYYSNRKTVHNKHHNWHHKCHNSVSKKHCLCKVFICLIKSFFFLLLSSKCSYNWKSCKNFSWYKIDIINKLLHLFKLWHSNCHKNKYKANNNKNCKSDNPLHSCACWHNLYNTTDTYYWCIKYHS